MSAAAPSHHASAVRVGARAVLIRGPSGSGKSRLAFGLIVAGRSGQIPPAELIADDRVVMEPREGRLWVRPVPELAGLIEIRGLGIRRCGFVAEAAVGLVVDLAADDAARLPEAAALQIDLNGVRLWRLPVGTGYDPLPLVVAALTTEAVAPATQLDDCCKDFGNHMSHTIVTE
ncbi:HPr kinase/phosphatase C-terminal domain-containing protein [Rhodopseudomonas sp. HC1]|uniref:HPr kinase/phosphorylase n=1 Tax=Rhodopseudomonas infernalis TaxID=2897386 RepID=UPI001EE89A5B|nr:HPr kinase/phosphatase C-terminal domain-containing protein [Rhodopseudomonas infernalis]MCG6206460.1 HPr kinase/phosphatase C-terminal domain-containing protein [Rhodopseudomonas infernalis]